MSYAQAMKWHKKHPRGIRNLYMGFDASSSPLPSPRYVCMRLKRINNPSLVWEYIGTMTLEMAERLWPDSDKFQGKECGEIENPLNTKRKNP